MEKRREETPRGTAKQRWAFAWAALAALMVASGGKLQVADGATLDVSRSMANPSITLGEGKVHRVLWSIGAERPAPPEGAGPHGGQRPCLYMAKGVQDGGQFLFTSFRLCYGTPGFLMARAEPLIVAGLITESGPNPIGAVGVAAAQAAQRIEITNVDGARRTIGLHTLNKVQARKVRLMRFSYAAFVLRGRWCVDRLRTLNARGATLWDSGSGICSAARQSGRAD